MKKILNITYDLRDKHNRKVTPAVENLINITRSDFEPIIVDLARVSNPMNEYFHKESSDHFRINVLGFPYGLLMYFTQNRVYKILTKKDYAAGIKLNDIDIIHSHKLTFEGLAGYKLSKFLNVPHIVTLRQTDTYVFEKKPGAVNKFKPVIENCGKIIYLIPGILLRMEQLFGKSFFDKYIVPKSVLIPNIVDKANPKMSANIDKGNFLTVLKMSKACVLRKNIRRLLMALSHIKETQIKLALVGNGDYMYKVKEWVRELNLSHKVQFIGNVNNEEIDSYYTSAEALLLPSISESFGLVYAESLLNGTPIMYSKDHLGFDGFFDGVGVAVNPLSVESIKNGILDLYANGDIYRENIRRLNKEGKFKIFSSAYIADKYFNIINSLA
jgi:glycosyltransferase involved in cell wall biosynthesis